MAWQIMTAVGTVAYAILVGITLIYIHLQFRDIRRRQKLESTLLIFKELQTRETREARRHIYTEVPFDILGLPARLLQEHLQKSEEALSVFDRLGFLLGAGHLDTDLIVTKLWPIIWRCWRKSRNLIQWTQQARNDQNYMEGFKYLYDVCESYRSENDFPIPRFYRVEPRIILSR